MKNAVKVIAAMLAIVSLVGCGEAEFDSAPTQLLVGPFEGNSEMKISSPNIADGESVTYVDLVIRDRRNLPIVGYKPEMGLTGHGNILGQCTRTDAQGRSRCTVWSSISEEKEVRIEGLELRKEVLWTPAPKFSTSFSVVSSGYVQTEPEVYSAVTASGVIGSSLVVADSNGDVRMVSTHFATLGR